MTQHAPTMVPNVGFDATDGKWHVLASKCAADIPVSTEGTPYDPWQIAGETSDPPNGGNDNNGSDEGDFTTDSGADTLTKAAHGLSSGTQCGIYDSGAGIPSGLSTATPYWLKALDANTIELYTDSTLATKALFTTAPTVGLLTATSDYFESTAAQPGHAWPFMSWSGTTRSLNVSAPSTISAGGYYPSCNDKEGYNHYRRFCRLAPRMFGQHGRDLVVSMSGFLLSTQATQVMDFVFHMNLATSVDGAGTNTTTFESGKRVGFRFATGNLGAAELAFDLRVFARAMGPFQSLWSAELVVAAAASPESTASAFASNRGPILLDLTSSGINMETVGAELAFLFAARRSSSCALYDIGTAGTSCVQDGSECYIKGGKVLALLSPGL